MKKSLFVAAFAALAVVACKKTEVVDTTNDMDSMDAPMVVDTMNSPMMEDSTTMKLGDSSTVVVEADKVIVEEAPAK